MNDDGKSDGQVIPQKPANNGDGAPSSAERVEGRGPTKGNSGQQTSHRAQERERLQRALDRVRQKASEDKDLRFTTLWHHVYDVGRLREAYFSLQRRSAPGVDGETWRHYGQDLEANLEDLSGRLQRGAYRAKPVRRVYIPKQDGRERPIGVPVLEDKIVQRATVEVLNVIYKVDFLGFSYGSRPGRSAHDALDAVVVGIERRNVSWVLDADIRGFYDAISHEWLVKFVEHRIADQRVIRHIKKWLKAGVLEDGEWKGTEKGSPQGGSASPLLANIYLHYALDLWVHQWRQRHARGDVTIVRYMDDFVMGFQHRADAVRFQRELKERLLRFGLELHPEKTRLIEFGRFAARNRVQRGGPRPPTFEFLGFTHYCGENKKGGFTVKRLSSTTRVRRKLVEISKELRRRRCRPVPEQGAWLRKVMGGWFRYHAVPHNYRTLSRFRREVEERWLKALRRRSQRGHRLTWQRMERLIDRWLPRARILHPHPYERLRVRTQGRSPVR